MGLVRDAPPGRCPDCTRQNVDATRPAHQLGAGMCRPRVVRDLDAPRERWPPKRRRRPSRCPRTLSRFLVCAGRECGIGENPRPVTCNHSALRPLCVPEQGRCSRSGGNAEESLAPPSCALSPAECRRWKSRSVAWHRAAGSSGPATRSPCSRLPTSADDWRVERTSKLTGAPAPAPRARAPRLQRDSWGAGPAGPHLNRTTVEPAHVRHRRARAQRASDHSPSPTSVRLPARTTSAESCADGESRRHRVAGRASRRPTARMTRRAGESRSTSTSMVPGNPC